MALTKVSGHVIDQPFDVGIITATNSYVSGIGTFGNIRVTGIGTFGNIRVTGDLQVDGTTTTLDTVVTEVDRLEVGANNSTVGVAITQSGSGDAAIFMGGNVGIATASPRQKLDVEGNINVVGIVTATTFVGNVTGNITGGSTADFTIADKIVHTGDTNTAIRFPAADTITAETGGTERVRITSDGKVGIGLTNPEWNIDIKDTSINAVVRLKSSGSTNGGQLQVNSDDLILRNRDAGEVQLWTNDANKLTITAAGAVRIPDNGKFTAGDDDDLQIYHNGTHSYVKNNTGGLYIQVANGEFLSQNGAEVIAKFLQNSAVELYYDNVKKFETTSTGIQVTGQVNASTMHLTDGNGIHIGNSNDLQIYHDGSDSYIEELGTGSLSIRSQPSITLRSAVVNINNGPNTENMARFHDGGAVELYYDNSKKLETTTTGAKVTGALEVTQEYPSIRPTLDLNFAATKTLDRRITFTRDSLGTYTDENGVLRTASNNVARFDHDPTTGESLGLLIEEVQDNLFTYSEEFNTGWTNIRSSESGTTATADPEGNTTGAAYKLVANTDNNTHRLDKTGLSMSTSTSYTMSIWAKAAEYTGVSLTIQDSSNSSHGIYFDLSNGTFTNGGNAHSGSMIAYPNGWYRCIATYTTPASFSYQQCLIGVLQNGTTKSYAGNNSSGIYIWGAQLEQGSFASSYIPTSGSTGTRWSDKAKIIGTNFTDFYNQTEGTFSVTAKPNEPNNGSNYYFIFEAANYSNYGNAVSIGKDSGNTYRLRPMKHSNLSDSSVAYTTNSVNIAIAGSGSGDGVAVVNGTVSATSTGAPSGTQDHNVLQIGNRYPGSSGGHYSGTIQSLKYYNKRLPNAQLQGLTQQ